MKRTRRRDILLSLLFGFAAWTAFALGNGGRSCTDDFQWWAAALNYEVELVFLPILWIPIVLVAAMAALAARLRFVRHPRLGFAAAAVALALVFGLSALFTHSNGHCPDF